MDITNSFLKFSVNKTFTIRTRKSNRAWAFFRELEKWGIGKGVAFGLIRNKGYENLYSIFQEVGKKDDVKDRTRLFLWMAGKLPTIKRRFQRKLPGV